MMDQKDIPPNCLRVPERDERDLEQRKHPAGTVVLCHPSAPQEFMRDSPDDRERFRRRDFTWTDETWRRVGLLGIHESSDDTKKHLDTPPSLRRSARTSSPPTGILSPNSAALFA